MKSILKIVLGTVILLSVACSGGKNSDAKNASETEKKAENVKVMELTTRVVARNIEYATTLKPYEEIHIGPASPGRITSILVEVGHRVSRGALLVQMDKTQLLTAEAQLKNLEADYRRLDTLQKVGSVSKQQYDQIKTQYEIAKTNVEFLKENTRLTAPFSGVISGRYFEAGEMYSGAPSGMTGKAAIVSLVQIDRLKTIVPISEKYFPLIKQGMVVNISCDIYPEKTFAGKITLIHPTIDAGSRTFNIEVVLNNTGGLLRPGMFSRVSLDLDQVEAILLPAHAVLKMQGSNNRYLFIEENGKARRIAVEMGRRYDDLIEVFSDDLHKGDRVIISGQARLIDGVVVNVVK